MLIVVAFLLYMCVTIYSQTRNLSNTVNGRENRSSLSLSQTLYAAMVASLEHLSLILLDHSRSRIRCIDLREVGPCGNLLKQASARTLCVAHLAMSQQLVGRINVALCHTECYQVLGRLQHASRRQFSCTKEKEAED